MAKLACHDLVFHSQTSHMEEMFFQGRTKECAGCGQLDGCLDLELLERISKKLQKKGVIPEAAKKEKEESLVIRVQKNFL